MDERKFDAWPPNETDQHQAACKRCILLKIGISKDFKATASNKHTLTMIAGAEEGGGVLTCKSYNLLEDF